jgi:hypothetical protein
MSPARPRRSGVTAKEGATPLSRPDEGFPLADITSLRGAKHNIARPAGAVRSEAQYRAAKHGERRFAAKAASRRFADQRVTAGPPARVTPGRD